MSDSDKKLYLRLELDQDKFRTAKEAIVDLTQRVRELAQELNKISFGGNSLLGGASTNTKEAIPIPSAGNSGSGATGMGGGASGLVGGVSSMASSLKGITSDATQSVKGMTAAVREAVDQQTASLGKLKGAFQEVKGQLDLFGRGGSTSAGQQLGLFSDARTAAPGALGGDNSQMGQLDLFGAKPPRTRPGEQLSLFTAKQLEPVIPETPQAAAGAGGGGFMGRLRSAFGGGGGSDIGNGLQAAMGAFGVPTGLFGGAGLTAAGVTGTMYIGRLLAQSGIENANESLQLGMDYTRRQAIAGSTMGIQALSMRGGQDLAGVAAARSLLNTATMRKMILGESDPYAIGHDAAAVGRQERFRGMTPSGLPGGGPVYDESGQPIDRRDARETLAQQSNSWFLNPVGKIKDLATDEVKNLTRRMEGDIGAIMRQTFQQGVEAKKAGDVENTAMYNFFQGNAPGGLGRMVAAGMGGRRTYDPTTGQTFYTDSTVGLGKGTPFSDEAVAQGIGQLGLQAGRGVRFRAKGLMLRQAGGLAGANEIFGSANQYGGGDSFIQAISQASSGNRTYPFLDTSASNAIGSYMAGTLQGGFGGTDGTAALEGALSIAAGASTSVGQDMRNARNFIQGGATYNNAFLRGGLDPLQQAINHYASKGLGGSMYGRLALERLTPTELAQFIREPNGPMGIALKGRGMKVEDARQYAQNTTNLLFARYSRAMGGDTDVASAVDAARTKGVAGYLKSVVGNKTGADRATALSQGIDLLGAGLDDASGRQFGQENARGVIMNIASQDTSLAAAIKGGRIGVATGGTEEQKLKDVQTAESERLMKEVQQNAKSVAETIKIAGPLGDKLVKLSTQMDLTGKHFVTAMENAAKAIEEKLIPAIKKIGR